VAEPLTDRIRLLPDRVLTAFDSLLAVSERRFELLPAGIQLLRAGVEFFLPTIQLVALVLEFFAAAFEILDRPVEFLPAFLQFVFPGFQGIFTRREFGSLPFERLFEFRQPGRLFCRPVLGRSLCRRVPGRGSVLVTGGTGFDGLRRFLQLFAKLLNALALLLQFLKSRVEVLLPAEQFLLALVERLGFANQPLLLPGQLLPLMLEFLDRKPRFSHRLVFINGR